MFPFIKLTTICLILIFALIPLAEFTDGINYNYAAPLTIHACLVGLYDTSPFKALQFKSLPLPN